MFDGVHAELEAFVKQRKMRLDFQKTDKYKQRRIELKVERTLDAQRRKDWSKKHGHDTYGSGDSGDDDGELKPKGQKKRKQGQISTGGKCKSCGSTSHLRSNHSECPFNMKNMKSGVSDEDKASENSDVIHYSGDAMSDSENSSCESRVASPDCHSEWCFEDDIICGDICTCGAHKKSCPLSSRNRYIGCTLFPKASSVDSQANADSCGKSELHKTGKVGTGSTRLGKRDRPATEKSPPAKKSTPNFSVGDYVSLHDSKLGKYHVPCCIVQMFGDRCLLCCCKGVLKTGYAKSQLTAISGDVSISVENWRSATKVSLREVANDSASLEVCNCGLAKPVVEYVIDLTKESTVVSPDKDSTAASNTWLSTPLYTLHADKKEEILSPTGWLSDTVIRAAQLLILQKFLLIAGLQDPSVHNSLSFEILRGEFVQIIIVGGCHWCTISNIECDDGVVNVYDSTTLKLIASLVYSPAEQLVVRMMDVGRQSNGSDCGVLAIAFAYDICNGDDPCTVKYDHRSIRRHLADCLEECCLSRFPVVGERRSIGIRHTQSVDLHCSCRLPEEEGDIMAECDVCKTWYHQHCMDIPDNVFDETEVPWKCKQCAKV